MKIRNKILLWTGALCLVVFAAWAANPSFSSFVTSQFATSGNVVRIKSSATLTNLSLTSSAGVALSVEDDGNVGTIASFSDFNATTVATITPSGLNLSGLTANTLLKADVSKYVVSIPNAAGFLMNDGSGTFSFSSSPSGIDWGTNGLTSTSAFPVSAGGTYAMTNMSGGLTFTGLAGSDSTHDRWGVVILDANGSDRTLTLPVTWRVSDGVRTITVTNGVVGILSVTAFANKYTNAVYRAFY